MSDTPLSYYWYSALRAPIGVCVKFENRISGRQQLYTARTEACDPALDAITLRLSPSVGDEIWLFKREKNAPAS